MGTHVASPFLIGRMLCTKNLFLRVSKSNSLQHSEIRVAKYCVFPHANVPPTCQPTPSPIAILSPVYYAICCSFHLCRHFKDVAQIQTALKVVPQEAIYMVHKTDLKNL
jgi:hypothetical protein